jgi:hypothetical protein
MSATKSTAPIDTTWFKDLIIAKQISQRKLAKAMNMEPAAVSRMLRGQRGMDPSEAAGLARELGVPLSEVLEHIGIDSAAGAASTATVKGYVNSAGTVHLGKAEGPRKVPVPVGMASDATALRFQGDAFTDGWLCFYQPGSGSVTECLGRLAIIQVAGKSEWYCRVLKRGYTKGTYSLIDTLSGGATIEDVKVASATPVLWLKTSV